MFLAFNNLLKRKEAVKIWIPKKCKKNIDVNRFREEAIKNAKVRFKNVAHFYDANIESNYYYARLEYIQGKTLKVFIQETQNISTRYMILKIILETMVSVYEMGLYHGDFHLENVIIKDDEPYIIDFGTSLFTGQIASRKRDCKMLIDLCYVVLPELLKLKFVNYYQLIKQDSMIVANFLLRSITIIWDIENTSIINLDTYAYKNWRFRFDILMEEFQFIDSIAVNKFLAENYLIK